MRVVLSSKLQLADVTGLVFSPDGQNQLEIELASPDCDLHPIIVCILSALDSAHDRSLIQSNGQLLDPIDIPYFARMDALNRFKVEDLTERPHQEGAGSFIPVRQILKNRDMGDFATDFVPLLHASPEQSNAVKYVLSELIRNVLEHAGSSSGAFAAAEVADDGTIRVGVADLGIGVLKSIRRSHSAATERDAISLALDPGISGATSKFGGNEQNGGAGLFFMKAMASLARQHMVIITGSTVMRMGPQSKEDVVVNPQLSDDAVEWSSLDTPLSGTAVGVDFSLRDSLAFGELLSEIRKVYQVNVGAKKREARKARFT